MKRKPSYGSYGNTRFAAGHIETEIGLIKTIFRWVVQAKATFLLMLTAIIMYVYSLRLSQEQFQSLVFTPEAIKTLDFVPMISSWFLHANLTHLIGNLIFLLVFGRIVERRFGFFKMLLIFFGSAILSDLISGAVFGQGGIGASGAIAGLIAAAMIVDPFYWTFVLGIPIPIILVGWIAVFTDISGLLNPVADNIGRIAHLGGFFATSLVIYFMDKRDVKIKRGFLINTLTFFVAVLIYFFFPQINIPYFPKFNGTG